MMQFIIDYNHNKPEQWLDASLLNHHSSREPPDLGSFRGLQMYLKQHLHRTRQTREPSTLDNHKKKEKKSIDDIVKEQYHSP